MKILYLIHQFFPRHITGTERLTLDIARQIQKMGHQVAVLTYEPSPPLENSKNSNFLYSVKKEDEFENVDNYILKKEYQIETVPVIALKHKTFKFGFEIFEEKLERHLSEIIKEFDCVHFTHPMRFSSALTVCKNLGIPTILTLTDNWLLCPRGLLTVDNQPCDGPKEGHECMSVCKYDKDVLKRYNEAKFFFENVDRVFSGTNFVRRTFWENGWKRNIELNTFSTDYSYVVENQTNNEKIVFAFIGSLIYHKGCHVLIKAFRKVKDEKIKLKIYGRGAKTDEYVKTLIELKNGESKNKEKNSDKRIDFCGTFDYSELPKIMKDISVIVIPSAYKEIFPLVMQMALAYKKPVIATDIGGIPEVIKNEVNGFLFPIGDDEKLAKIIQNITENPKIIDELRDNIVAPRRIEEEFLVYENTYRELLGV